MAARLIDAPRGAAAIRKSTDTWDQHFGWESKEQKATRLSNEAHTAAQNDFRNGASSGVNYSMSYTNPKTGFTERYDPSTGGGASGSLTARTPAPAPAPVAPERVSLDALMSDYSKMSGPAPAPIEGPPRANRLAANEAAYGAAKSKIGLQNRASLNSLRNMMSERNIEGSGIEGALGANIIGHGQSDLANVVVNQTGSDLKREQDVEDRNYSGGIAQRGQDMQQQSQKRAAIEALFRMRGGNDARLY